MLIYLEKGDNKMGAVKQIIKEIILAQVSSDYPKGRTALRKEIERSPKRELMFLIRHYGYTYAHKDIHIKTAIKYICATHPKEVHFYVKVDADKVAKYLIYFDIKVNGKRRQVSFHSFSDEWKRYLSPVGSSTHWDRKCSQQNCIELFKEFFS